MTFKFSHFHRVIDDFMIQGGDITAGDGTGGASIYGGEFEDENLGWRHIDIEGLLCMANRGKNTNSSQFFITLAPCEHLNAKHTVFGQVVSGKDVYARMAKVAVDSQDRPLQELLILNCGELQRRQERLPISTIQKFPGQHKADSSRGRKRPKQSRSTGRSRSRSSSSAHSTRRRRKHPKSLRSPPPPPTISSPSRRRSDVMIDETRRGRTLTRSPSPRPIKAKQKPSRSPISRHHRRKRSPPLSRSRSRVMSSSPHIRRRRSRSRSHDHSQPQRRMRKYVQGEFRDDEEMIQREEAEREGGRERWEGVIKDEGEPHIVKWSIEGSGRKRESRGVALGEGRSGGNGGSADSGAEVKFKGRGGMKYREKK